MNAMEEYRRVVRELCEHTGMHPWEEIAEAQHMEVDGATVGLIVDQGTDSSRLCLYFDLGAEGQPDMYRALLEANLALEPEEPGYFGSHPENGAIVYRVNLPLTRYTGGVELVVQIQQALGAGREKLERLLSGVPLHVASTWETDGSRMAV